MICPLDQYLTLHHILYTSNHTYIHTVSWPKLVNYLNWTPIFEFCVVRCGFKKEHQRDVCLKETGLHA